MQTKEPWLLISKETGRVESTLSVRPSEGSYDAEKYELKEWHGLAPAMDGVDPDTGKFVPGDLDPTLDNPDYDEFVQRRLDFDGLAALATGEIQWLEETIPNIDTMSLEELRSVLKRTSQENLYMIKAWRFVVKKLG